MEMIIEFQEFSILGLQSKENHIIICNNQVTFQRFGEKYMKCEQKIKTLINLFNKTLDFKNKFKIDINNKILKTKWEHDIFFKN